MKTFSARPEDVVHGWFVVDAAGVPLGRLATNVASVLRGKHKPIFTPHVDTGDNVIVVNASAVKLSGSKTSQKIYDRFTGWPGGYKTRTAREMLDRDPGEVIRTAVRGMLPKNSLGRHMLMKLKVYEGPEHPHTAQKPQPLAIR